MKKVKLSFPNSVPPLKRQTPNNALKWGDYEFFLNEETGAVDYWFVLDQLPAFSETALCPPNQIFLVTGEPPWVKLYSKAYTNQFSKVLTCQQNILKRANATKSNPFLPWMAGARQIDGMKVWDNEKFLDYDFFLNNKPISKINKIGIITSNKIITKGHKKRMDFVHQIEKEFSAYVDLYGNGFNPIPDKYDVFSKYKYMVVIENCQYPSYWTEKLADAFLCDCYPLYIGAPDICKYFPKESLGILNMEDLSYSKEIIKTTIDLDLYEKNKESINQAKLLVLNKYNLFAQIADFLNTYSTICQPMNPERVIIEMKNDIECKIKNRLKKYIQIDF